MAKYKKTGMPPGTLVYTGEKRDYTSTITRHTYNLENYSREALAGKKKDFDMPLPEGNYQWINVNGVHDVKLIERIGQSFKVHSLHLEDILNADQAPKTVEEQDHIFITLKSLRCDHQSFIAEHISLLFGANLLISFQEFPEDAFQAISDRVGDKDSRLRRKGADYLAFLLLDFVCDHYHMLADELAEQIEAKELALLQGEHLVVEEFIELKKQQLALKRAVLPLRDAVRKMLLMDNGVIQENNKRYYNDLLDVLVALQERSEAQREMLSALLDLNMAETSNRMNVVMQRLTVIATIFIPLTFLVGVYGMNFSYMPELAWEYGYFAFWFVIVVGGIGMAIYMKQKKWF